MKKLILSTAAILGIATAADAQFVRYGVKGGLDLSTAPINSAFNNIENKLSPGVYVGGLAEMSFRSRSDKFKLQVEANYTLSQLKNEYDYRNFDHSAKTTLHTINIPVLAKYFFTPRFSLYAGPTANFNLGSKFSNTNFTGAKPDANVFQLGAMLGANYYIYKGFFVEARYHAVFPDEYENGNPIEYGTASNFQVGIGYKFR